MADAEVEGTPEEREEKLKRIQEKLDFLMTKENLQEDSFIQMNMDAQMNIPICILAGHEQFEEMGQIVDVTSLYDAALKSEHVVVDKIAMQLKPIIKSKRNTVILHDLPDQIPLEELQELFEKCPSAEKLKSIKPDVNSTAFVTFEDDSAAQDAALWLRSQQLRGAKVKCSMKSEQFLRSFFPMKPVPNFQSYSVPAWAAAWTGQWAAGWPGAQPPVPGGKDGKGMEKGGFKGPSEGMAPSPHGPNAAGPFTFAKGKGKSQGWWGKGDGKSKGEAMSPLVSEEALQFQQEANDSHEVDADDDCGYRHSFRRYTRQQIMEICGKMELVEKPESYKKMEATSDIALFSQQPNKDWAPLPTPLGSFMGSESRRTQESDTNDEETHRRPRKESQRESQASAADWEWENWNDPNAGGWTENRHGYKSGKMQWVAKTKPGAEEPKPSKPTWAEKVRGGGTQKWQAKAKPAEATEDAAPGAEDSAHQEVNEAKRPSWADKVRQSLGE